MMNKLDYDVDCLEISDDLISMAEDNTLGDFSHIDDELQFVKNDGMLALRLIQVADSLDSPNFITGSPANSYPTLTNSSNDPNQCSFFVIKKNNDNVKQSRPAVNISRSSPRSSDCASDNNTNLNRKKKDKLDLKTQFCIKHRTKLALSLIAWWTKASVFLAGGGVGFDSRYSGGTIRVGNCYRLALGVRDSLYLPRNNRGQFGS